MLQAYDCGAYTTGVPVPKVPTKVLEDKQMSHVTKLDGFLPYNKLKEQAQKTCRDDYDMGIAWSEIALQAEERHLHAENHAIVQLDIIRELRLRVKELEDKSSAYQDQLLPSDPRAGHPGGNPVFRPSIGLKHTTGPRSGYHIVGPTETGRTSSDTPNVSGTPKELHSTKYVTNETPRDYPKVERADHTDPAGSYAYGFGVQRIDNG